MAYRPRGGALELFEMRDSRILLEGPADTGKTRGLLQYFDLLSTLCPGIRTLIARETSVSMRESILVTLETKVWFPEHDIWKTAGNATRQTRTVYTYPRMEAAEGPSTIVVGGLSDVGWTYSMEYDLVGVFEAWEVSRDAIERLYRANRNHVLCRYLPANMPLVELVQCDWSDERWMRKHECWQQIILDTNPAEPWSHLNQNAAPISAGDAQRIARGESPSRRVFRSPDHQFTRIITRHEDNPACTAADLEKLRALTGPRRARLYLGLWVSQEGQIYEEFDALVHMVTAKVERPGDPPKEEERGTKIDDRRIVLEILGRDDLPKRVEITWTFATMDFGFVHAGTLQVWGADKEGRLWMLAEVYHTGKRDDWWTERLLDLYCEFNLARLVCDSEDRERIERLNDRMARIKGRPNERIAEGVNKSARSRPGDYVVTTIHMVKDALAGRRLFFLRDTLRHSPDQELVALRKPTSVAQEITGYTWKLTLDGRALDEPDQTTVHDGCDATRYAVQFATDLDLAPILKLPKVKPGSLGAILKHDQLDGPEPGPGERLARGLG